MGSITARDVTLCLSVTVCDATLPCRSRPVTLFFACRSRPVTLFFACRSRPVTLFFACRSRSVMIYNDLHSVTFDPVAHGLWGREWVQISTPIHLNTLFQIVFHKIKQFFLIYIDKKESQKNIGLVRYLFSKFSLSPNCQKSSVHLDAFKHV